MALIFEGSRCAVCRERIKSEPYMATSGVAFPPEHPLHTCCDAGIHWRCYRNWEHREEFATAYHQGHLRWARGNPFWVMLREAESWFAMLNPRAPEAVIYFRRTATRLSFDEQSWELEPALDHDERELIGPDLAECRASLGSWGDFARDYDPVAYESGIRQWHEREAEEKRQRESAFQAELAPGQARWKAMRAELVGGSLYCPHCRQAHANIRAYDRSPMRKSIFICQVCAFSFDPDGLPDWHKLGSS